MTTTIRRALRGALATPGTPANHPGGPNPTEGPIDWIAVERAISGEHLPLNHAEAYNAARHLHTQHTPSRDIAATVGVSDRTITRWNVAGYPNREIRPTGTLGTPTTEPAPSKGEPAMTSSTDDWRHQATCREADPELFFPKGNTGPFLLQIEEAKAVCRRCPVMEQCLQWALETGQDSGVWGGMSEDERRAMKRRAARNDPNRQRRRIPARCGTRGGYKRHQREHSAICQPCRDANTAYGRKLNGRDKQAVAA